MRFAIALCKLVIFLALSATSTTIRRLPPPFANLLSYFSTHNVRLVVRLNNSLYDKAHFTDMGIRHEELFFEDGTNPTDEIVRKFIAMSEEILGAGGVVGVHVSDFFRLRLIMNDLLV